MDIFSLPDRPCGRWVRIHGFANSRSQKGYDCGHVYVERVEISRHGVSLTACNEVALVRKAYESIPEGFWGKESEMAWGRTFSWDGISNWREGETGILYGYFDSWRDGKMEIGLIVIEPIEKRSTNE